MNRPEQDGYDGFLSRWSRRKTKSRSPDNSETGTDATNEADATTPVATESADRASLDKTLQSGLAASQTGELTDADLSNPSDADITGLAPQDAAADAAPVTQTDTDTPGNASDSEGVDDDAAPPLPPLESLTEDSDYSPFMAPNVSGEIRKLALRKLFKSAIFGVRDGLDDYDEDFTSFEPLGNTITADMRHHIERKEKLAQQEREREQRASADEDALTEDMDDDGDTIVEGNNDSVNDDTDTAGGVNTDDLAATDPIDSIDSIDPDSQANPADQRPTVAAKLRRSAPDSNADNNEAV